MTAIDRRLHLPM